MKVKLTYQGKTRAVELPESWGQVSWEQMMRLQKGENHVFVFSGISEADWLKADSAESYVKFNYLLEWTKEKANFGESFKIKVDDKMINFKGFDIKLEDIGQYLDCEEVIKKYAGGKKKKRLTDLTDCYPEIIAIYVQKELDGAYNYFGRTKKNSMERGRIEEIKNKIGKNPYGAVFTIGNFFLSNMVTLTRGVPLRWRLYSYLIRKSGLVRRLFPPSMGLSQTSLLW